MNDKRGHYILKKKQIFPVGLFEWATFYDSDQRIVKQEHFTLKRQPRFLNPKRAKKDRRTVFLSTTFLGIDYYGGMFETMFFCDQKPGKIDTFERCHTYTQAQRVHKRAVGLLRVNCHRFVRVSP